MKKNKTKKKRLNKQSYAVIYICLCFVLSIGSHIHQHSIDQQKYEKKIDEIIAEHESTIIQMNEEHYAEIIRLRSEYETKTPEDVIREEAEYIARVLYGYRNNSERDLRTAVWCILNRVDNSRYPDIVKEVCQQDSQWIGYSDDNPILNNFYEIAVNELETWHNGYRPVTEDYVYMSWSSKEIVLRDTYNSTKTTRHWQAG